MSDRRPLQSFLPLAGALAGLLFVAGLILLRNDPPSESNVAETFSYWQDDRGLHQIIALLLTPLIAFLLIFFGAALRRRLEHNGEDSGHGTVACGGALLAGGNFALVGMLEAAMTNAAKERNREAVYTLNQLHSYDWLLVRVGVRRQSLNCREPAVPDFDPEDVAVADRNPAVARAVEQDGAEGAAVRDHEHTLVRVSARDAPERRDDTLRHLVVRLSVSPLAAARVREADQDLVVGEAFPGPEVLLAQGGNCRYGKAFALRDDERRLVRAREVARVDGVERLALELVGERPRLGTAGLVQRPVRVPLNAAPEVPVRLAVACEEDRGHAL